MDIETPEFALKNISKINVILGKNGCGKSHLLKLIEQFLQGNNPAATTRYISPERGGALVYEPGIEQSITSNDKWLGSQRRRNQSSDFRQQSFALFRKLELRELRAIERAQTRPDYRPRTFDTVVNQLNSLLERIKVVRDDRRGFDLYNRDPFSGIGHDQISSGEAELVSLGIEVLSFVSDRVCDRKNFLLIDEPDVHLHPDLQHRLAKFIVGAVGGKAIHVLIATHSTSLLAGLAESATTHVAFMSRGDKELIFKSVDDIDKTLLPIFGAHPLSNAFNKTPLLLLEGEDDERIWQTAVRASKGKIRVHPCSVDGKQNLIRFEKEANRIIGAVYDEARAYSLRDRDTQPDFIEDEGAVVRMRLHAHEAENLILTDESLKIMNITWEALRSKMDQWLADDVNEEHPYYEEMKSFKDAGFPRSDGDIKNIRMIVVGLVSNKPWEVIVGTAIASNFNAQGPPEPNSIREYLGKKVSENLLKAGW